MRACKCPNCGANLNFDETPNNYAFCQYCGAKIDFLDQRTMHTEHIIDDAKIKESEAKLKNAENVSRIVNIFAAPVEEKQRQKEFERQQQAEAARREYEREKRKEAERRENREAMEDGCAAALGKLMVGCVKHPFIALIIAVLMLGSCMRSSSSSSSSSVASSYKSTVAASSAESVSSSELEMYSDRYLSDAEYTYDMAYVRHSDSTYYYLISYKDHIVTFINFRTNLAVHIPFKSGDLTTGIDLTFNFPVSHDTYTTSHRTLKLTKITDDSQMISKEDDKEFAFEKTDIETALTDLRKMKGRTYNYNL